MFRARYMLASLLVGLAIALGCTKPNSGTSTTTVADKSQDARIARLEADLKKANEELARLSAQSRLDQAAIKDLEKQRDNLKQLANNRTQERDNAAAKLDMLRKNVKELLGQVESAAAEPFKPLQEPVTVLPPPVVPVVSIP